MYLLHHGRDGVLFHFPDATSDYPQVGNYGGRLERFAGHPVHGDVGKRDVLHRGDRKGVRFDRTERTVGDGHLIDGRYERSRRQFVGRQVFQYHLRIIIINVLKTCNIFRRRRYIMILLL